MGKGFTRENVNANCDISKKNYQGISCIPYAVRIPSVSLMSLRFEVPQKKSRNQKSLYYGAYSCYDGFLLKE